MIDCQCKLAPSDLVSSTAELAAYAASQAAAPVSVPSFPAPQVRLPYGADPADPSSPPPPVWPAWDRPIPPCTYPTAFSSSSNGTIVGDGGQDVYGAGGLLNHFEAHVANALGKEGAVWCPTGTLAQQVALRLHAHGRNRIFACHPKSHLLLHESQAFDVLQGFSALQIGAPGKPMTPAQVEAAFAKHWKQPCALLLELPERELGGQCIPWEELVELRGICDRRGIKMHMDGARLFEVAVPFYRRSLQEICSLFDSVYISAYKGLCGPPGALLLGSAPLCARHASGCTAWAVGRGRAGWRCWGRRRRSTPASHREGSSPCSAGKLTR